MATRNRGSDPSDPGRPELPNRYMTLDELVHYTSISRRQLERYLRGSVNPLRPSAYNGRRPLFLRSDVDAWLATTRPAVVEPPAARSADEIIAEVTARVRALNGDSAVDRTAVRPYSSPDVDTDDGGDGWPARGRPSRKRK